MIIRCDDDQRHLLNSGNVHSFVERARLHSAFADATQADESLFASESFRHQRAHRHRNHRAKMTDHGELIIARSATMNIAIASAHWALARAEISACDIQERFAKRRAPRLIANQWREDVSFLQKQAAGDTDRFLPPADIDAARDQAAAVKADELFFEGAGEQHPTKRFEETLMRRGFGCCGFFAARRRFKHPPILPKIDKYARNFSESCQKRPRTVRELSYRAAKLRFAPEPSSDK